MNGTSGGDDDPPDPNKSSTNGAWGPNRPRGGPGTGGPTYSSIASINTSVRDNKNLLEIRLERQEGSTFNLSMQEIEHLLKRLNIDSSHLLGVSACPEGKPVVLITLHASVDIHRFLYRNESYVVKQGVRTTTIRPEGKKEKLVKITGLHPNTKDQAVVKYLAAHGIVSPNAKVIHHVFPGETGSSLLAGKLNGNRSYMVELKLPMGSYHIIDGEKVSVRYSGQEWTCARCHQYKKDCPGAAIARDCTADRVLLSSHMQEHWQKVGYQPETDALGEVDETNDLDIQVGGKKKENFVIPESTLTSKYRSVIVKGFRAETTLESILEILLQQGLPVDYTSEHIVQNKTTGSLTVENLKPEECLSLIENMNRRRFLNRTVYVTSVVGDSPVKPTIQVQPASSDSSSSPNSKAEDHQPPYLGNPLVPRPSPSPIIPAPDPLKEFALDTPVSPNVQGKISQIEKQSSASSIIETPVSNRADKRKSEASPESAELSRKEKKILREEEKKQEKLRKKQEHREKNNVKVQINHSY